MLKLLLIVMLADPIQDAYKRVQIARENVQEAQRQADEARQRLSKAKTPDEKKKLLEEALVARKATEDAYADKQNAEKDLRLLQINSYNKK